MSSHNLTKVLERVKDSAERTMQRDISAAAVLNGLVNQYAMPLLRFKQSGTPPDVEGLEDMASKLIAIVAATYDAMDARKGTLP